MFILMRSQVCEWDCSETFLARNGLFDAGRLFCPRPLTCYQFISHRWVKWLTFSPVVVEGTQQVFFRGEARVFHAAEGPDT